MCSPFPTGLGHHRYGPAQNWNRHCPPPPPPSTHCDLKPTHPHYLARQHLKKAAMHVRQIRNKRLAGKPFTTGDSVWLYNVRGKKKKEMPSSGHISAVRCSLPYPEERGGQAKGHSCRPIKVLPRIPTGEMDSKKPYLR